MSEINSAFVSYLVVIVFLAFASTACTRDVSVIAIESSLSIHPLHGGTGGTFDSVPSGGGTCFPGGGRTMLGVMGVMIGVFSGRRNGALVDGRCG